MRKTVKVDDMISIARDEVLEARKYEEEDISEEYVMERYINARAMCSLIAQLAIRPYKDNNILERELKLLHDKVYGK